MYVDYTVVCGFRNDEEEEEEACAEKPEGRKDEHVSRVRMHSLTWVNGPSRATMQHCFVLHHRHPRERHIVCLFRFLLSRSLALVAPDSRFAERNRSKAYKPAFFLSLARSCLAARSSFIPRRRFLFYLAAADTARAPSLN